MVAALLVELDGDVMLPLFERLEREKQDLEASADTRNRARQLLSRYSLQGGGNAIRSKNLTLSSSDGPRPYLGFPVR